MRVWLHKTSHASSQLLSTWLLLSRYTTTRGSTMTKRLCLPGISLRIEECTQCGASSGSSETLGESMAMKLAHVLQIFWLFPFRFPFPFPRFRVSSCPCCPTLDKFHDVSRTQHYRYNWVVMCMMWYAYTNAMHRHK